MSIDIRTMALTLVLLNSLQVIAFLFHCLTDRSTRGVGFWLCWSAATALGFLCMFLRELVPGGWVQVSILATNTLLLVGHMLLYVGITRFLGWKGRRGALYLVFALFLTFSLLFTYAHANDNVRTAVFYLSVFLVSSLAAECLYFQKTPSLAASASFLALFFVAHGAYLLISSGVALTTSPGASVFENSGILATMFVVPFVTGYLWAFGLMFMVNQSRRDALQESRERFERIFETSPDAALITRLQDGLLVEANEGFLSLTGYSRPELVGKTTMEVGIWKNPTDRTGFVRLLNDQGFLVNREYAFQRRDGSEFRGTISARLVSLHGIAHAISITHDVSEQRSTEEALRQSEEKFRLLVENSHDIIYTLSADGTFLFVSPAWTALLGHPTAEVVGRSIRTFVHPEDLSRCFSFLKSVIDTGLKGTGIEYRVRHSDGTWYWHTTNAAPFRDGTGAVRGLYGIARDVTERRIREQNQKDLIFKLQKALEEIKTLSGIVPICVNCKKIRDDGGYWSQVESYVAKHTEARFSHSLCPECMKKLYPEVAEEETDGGDGG